MSFLERLKREADQQRLQAEQAAREREALETRYRTQIEPRMKALTQYLEGLAATLLEVRPAFVVQMPIQGYGDLCTVPFYDYKVEHERRHRSFLVTMTWSLRVDPERTPAVRADNATRVRTLTNLFRQYHLGGIKEERRTPQGEISAATFHARGYIKARLQAQISAEDPVLRMVLDNASWLGSSRKQVPWERIDDALFDRIARFVVREDDSLFSEELPEELRQRLRRDQPPAATPAPATAPIADSRPLAAPDLPAVAVPPTQQAAPTPEPAAPDPLPAALGAASFVPSVIPAPAPVSAVDVIEFDESKLGLDRFEEPDESFGAAAFGAPLSLAPVPPPVGTTATAAAAEQASKSIAAPAPAAPPPAPAPAPGQPRAAAEAPGSVPAAHSPPPSSPTTRVARPAQPAAPVATAAAGAVPVDAAPAAADSGAAQSADNEREAALFRLKVRAMLARMRTTDDPGKS